METEKKKRGDRLRAVRTKLNLTQTEFGAKLGGVKTSSISGYESGDTYPKPDILVKIAELGQVSLAWLITGGELFEEQEGTGTSHEKEIGGRVKIALDKAGIDQKKFAALAKKSESTISGYLNGKIAIPVHVLGAVKHICDASLDWLITGKKEISGQIPQPVVPSKKTDVILSQEKGELNPTESPPSKCDPKDLEIERLRRKVAELEKAEAERRVAELEAENARLRAGNSDGAESGQDDSAERSPRSAMA